MVSRRQLTLPRAHLAVIEGVNRILEAALTVRTAEELGEVCIEVALDLTDGAYGFIGELGSDGMVHDIALSGLGWESCAMRDKSGHVRSPGTFPVRGLYGRVIGDALSIITNTPAAHPDAHGVPAGHPTLDSFLGVPLKKDGHGIGVIAVANREGGFQSEQQRRLEAIAPTMVEAFSRMRARATLTERHQALGEEVRERTAALEESREQLRENARNTEQILESISDGVFVMDLEWCYTYVNPQGLRLSQKTIEEMTDHRLWDLFPDLIGTKVERRFRRAMERAERDVFEYYYEPFDVWLEYRLYPVPGGLLEFVSDITPRKRAEEDLARANEELERKITERTAALHESEQRLMLATEAAQIGIYDLDVASGAINWDPRVREVWEADLDAEITMDTLFAGVHPDDRDSVGREVERMFDPHGPRRYNVEYRVRGLKTGVESWVAAYGTMLFEGDRPVRLVGTIQDITQRKRAEAAAERASRLNRALNQINHTLMSTLSVHEMLERVVVEASEAAGADKSLLFRPEQDRWVVTHQHGFDPELVGTSYPTRPDGMMSTYAESDEPVLEEHAGQGLSSIGREFVERNRVASYMLLQLQVHDDLIGMLLFGYEYQRSFESEDLDFARRLSSAISLALSNARVFETEHTIASQLQSALLALPEHVSGIEFAHAYRSAADTSRVGGDFYDVFELSHQHVGITIGDVAGKGLDAAVLTSLAKNTIRAHASETGKTPSQILALANEMLLKTTPTESFVTLFIGILDTRDGRLVYANAGHTTGLVLRGDGGYSGMPVTGPILGAFSDSTFDEGEVRLDPNDVLFLYTDGLTEARRGRDFYGEEGLIAAVERLQPESPQGAIEGVVCDVVSFTRGALSDDMAMLAVSLSEQDGELPVQQKLEL